MKFFFLILCLFLAGCGDEVVMEHGNLTKGIISEKIYIPSKDLSILNLNPIFNDRHQYCVYSHVPDIFMIVIQVTEKSKGTTYYHRSFWQVTPTLFGELEVGKEIDVRDNPSIKIANVW